MIEYFNRMMRYATERQRQYIELRKELGSNNAVAKSLGIDRRAVDRGISSAYRKAREAGEIVEAPSDTRIALFDIETAPIIGSLWSLWQKSVSPKQVIRDTYVLSYSYKWLDEDLVVARSINQTPEYKENKRDDSGLMHDLWMLLNEADLIVGHNGDKFDLKRVRTRLLIHGYMPPSPVRSIDTLKIAKREFGFTSNRLDFIARSLLGADVGKLDTGGHELWDRCVDGDEEAFALMREYNARDVELLERVYKRMRAWDRSHPVVNHDHFCCTACGSENVVYVPEKYVYTAVSKFPLFRCEECGHNMRGVHNQRDPDAMQSRLVNAR